MFIIHYQLICVNNELLLIYSKYMNDHKCLLIISYIFANIVNKKLSVCDYSIFLTY